MTMENGSQPVCHCGIQVTACAMLATVCDLVFQVASSGNNKCI